MKLEYRTFSECGPRYKNEDTLAIVEMPEQGRSLFVLCDGMGGHRSGDIASQTVIKSLTDYWKGNPKRKDSEKKIIDASEQAKIALEHRPQVEMGTTMAMAAIQGNQLLIAHSGDSRVYVYDHSGRNLVRTRDHIKPNPEGWAVLYKGFVQGMNCHIPEIDRTELHFGDVIFICSDDVYNAFKIGELEDILESSLSVDDMISRIKMQCDTKSRDNYSAILIKVVEDDHEVTTRKEGLSLLKDILSNCRRETGLDVHDLRNLFGIGAPIKAFTFVGATLTDVADSLLSCVNHHICDELSVVLMVITVCGEAKLMTSEMKMVIDVSNMLEEPVDFVWQCNTKPFATDRIEVALFFRVEEFMLSDIFRVPFARKPDFTLEKYSITGIKQYSEPPYSSIEKGELITVVYQDVNAQRLARFLRNHYTKQGYDVQDENGRLVFVRNRDIKWNTISRLSDKIVEAVKRRSVCGELKVHDFRNDVALVEWPVADDCVLTGFIDNHCKILSKFRLISAEDDIDKLRAGAESKAKR